VEPTGRERLSPLDVSFLYLEGPTTAMHVGGVAIFEVPASGYDYDGLVDQLSARIASVRRYRQKVRFVPGGLAGPVWVDDPDFDLGYHVRRSGLPRPGSDEQLRELVGRLQARPLDRHHPLWEMYVVEGLAGDRFAIVTKTHHAMVDGVAALDIGQLILDPSPTPRDPPPLDWTPEPEPSSLELLAESLADVVAAPSNLVDVLRHSADDARRTAGSLGTKAGGLLAAVRTAARRAPTSPLNVDIGGSRRYGTACTELDDYKRVRKAHGGTVNDVVLATVSGALRRWLLSRGERVPVATTVRAMVPVSVRGADAAGELGNRISAYLVDLPVGDPDPVHRLASVSAGMRAHKSEGQSVGADALVALGGFAPPTIHALGARAVSAYSRRLFNLVVTNVPGPQFPLYAAGARMLEAFPVVPLVRGQAVSIGLTSYDGRVFYGLNADREAMPDVEVLGGLIEESLAELVRTV